MSYPVFMRRRDILLSAAGLVAFAHQPALAARTGRDPRLLVMFLRGGMDGLTVVPAIGDPAYLSARQLPAEPPMAKGIALDGFYELNGMMPKLGTMFREKQALIVHAVASPYRDRSHFSAQDVMESGFWPVSSGGGSGWLNRAMQALPQGAPAGARPGLAVAPTIPLMMQGKAPIETFQQQRFAYVDDDTVARLVGLYDVRDKVLAQALREGADLDKVTRGGTPAAMLKAAGRPDFATDVAMAAGLLARADGPRIGMINLIGWDTHIAGINRLEKQLASLDDALGAARAAFGPAWQDTVLMVITEFGRTVKFNGAGGTDHGNGTVAFLAGGAVRGGKVLADWPGLRADQLLDGRDLRPTTDIRDIFKGVLADHFGIGSATLEQTIFPGTIGMSPAKDLIA